MDLCLKVSRGPPLKHLPLQNRLSVDAGPGSIIKPGLRQEPLCCSSRPPLPTAFLRHSSVGTCCQADFTSPTALNPCEPAHSCPLLKPELLRPAQTTLAVEEKLSTELPFLDTGCLGAGSPVSVTEPTPINNHVLQCY